MRQDLGFFGQLLSWATGRRRPSIFLSYRRRGEASGFAGRLADRLVEHFGAAQVFRDIEDIESGVDFVSAIDEAVEACQALLVVIGPDWLTVQDANGRRRLDDPRDFVRVEVESALRRNRRVIPVLVCGAGIPAEQDLPRSIAALARRQAHELSDKRWDYDVGELVKTLESLGIRPARSGRRATTPSVFGTAKRGTPKAAITVGVAVAVLALGVLLAQSITNHATVPPAGTPTGVTDPKLQDHQLQPTQQGTGLQSSANLEPIEQPIETPTAEQQVVNVVAQSAESRIYAAREMDPQALARNYVGPALQFLLGQIQFLSSQGIFAVNVLHDQTIRSVRVSPDGVNALVQLEETWSAQHISMLTRQCALHFAPHVIPHTLYLAFTERGWMIHGIELSPMYQAPPGFPCY